MSNFPPLRCGIAEFTDDLANALSGADPRTTFTHFALTDDRDASRGKIRRDCPQDFRAAAAAINAARHDLVCVQHEFGIFGGEAGAHLFDLLDHVRAPIVMTLHTVLANPNPDQARVMTRLARRVSKFIVMAEKGRTILRERYGVPAERIEIIPHGAPDADAPCSVDAKRELGLTGRRVMLTFGLLSPNKGVEVMIRAMPEIVAAHPDALYVVVGATHPHLVAREGEAYRTQLKTLAQALGVFQHVQFVNEFVGRERLLSYLSASDIYVTPYLHEAQITSGTLAYAIGMGKAIVSTPYWHAAEALADERGLLIPFNDCEALATACNRLLGEPQLHARIAGAAWRLGQRTKWSRIGERYFSICRAVAQTPRQSARAPLGRPFAFTPNLDGVAQFTDGCGILQHGAFDAPDRRHGYCLDDNARALMLVNAFAASGLSDARLSALCATYAAFVNHAWNGRTFRNFMSYERAWLEAEGSADSIGRALWAIGDTALRGTTQGRRLWAANLFRSAIEIATDLKPIRARAFALMGLIKLRAAGHEHAALATATLAARLHHSWRAAQMSSAPWFEPIVSYDNARLPEALLRAGAALGEARMIEDGLSALDWLCRLQTAPMGWFRPVGSDNLGCAPSATRAFDQQPLEAAATVDACAAAFAATQDTRWIEEARRAFAWFTGENDHGAPLIA
ncbi:MAG: glycosyltransferase family 4 protein, partial [Hyphomonadaceae bacterium]